MSPSEAEVRDLVRRILSHLLSSPGVETSVHSAAVSSSGGGTPAAASPASVGSPTQDGQARRVVDESAVRELAPGSTLIVSSDALITPLARQIALERRVSIERRSPGAASMQAGDSSRGLAASGTGAPSGRGQKPLGTIALGADHGGFALKEALKPHVQSLGYDVVDCGTSSTDPVDYPDIAYAVARLVAGGRCLAGIIVDGAGIGSAMAANKVPGIRAALCYDHATAVNSREHNHANVLTLGAGLIGTNLAKQIVTDWLATPYGTGRHAKRVEKIMDIERRHLRKES